MNPKEFEEIYETTKELHWDYDFLSSCNYITWNMVRNNLNKPWNFKKISRNSIVTIDIVLDTPFLRWDWNELTLNKNMTFDIIKNNIRLPWNSYLLTQKLTPEELKQFYNIRESLVDTSSIDSYDSYNSDNYIYQI